MILGKSWMGMMTVEFTAGAPEVLLDALTQAGIPLFRVRPVTELTYRLLVRQRDFRELAGIVEHHGGALGRRFGIGFLRSMGVLVRRPVLVFTCLLLLASSVYLPSRVFFVEVEGNETVPARLILSAAEEQGIGFGSSRKDIRSERMKNALLAAVPQLQWAGINTSGCRAVLSVRERGSEEEILPEPNVVSHLVAHRDGYILSATVTKGTAHCAPGDAVTKGQLLVSGYTDCGICIRASRAEGEIYAQTNRNLRVCMPESYVRTGSAGPMRYGISLIFGKKRINLWKDSRISGVSCGRMYEEYYVSLPGGFLLPVAVCLDRYWEYRMQESVLPESAARQLLGEFSEGYLKQQMIAGRILRTREEFSLQEGNYRMESSSVCTEMIGKAQRDQIGVINGKRN